MRLIGKLETAITRKGMSLENYSRIDGRCRETGNLQTYHSVGGAGGGDVDGLRIGSVVEATDVRIGEPRR